MKWYTESMVDDESRIGIALLDRPRFTYDPSEIVIPDGFVAPFRVNYETNEICNMKCGFCFADYHEGETVHAQEHILTLGQLNTAEVKGMIDQAAHMGTTQFLLGGGDPFIRSDMPDLIEHADESGLQVVVDTNGLLLSRRKGLLERVAPHLHQLGLSLDGSTPVAHDTFRGTQRSFEAVMDLIQRSAEYDYKLKINTVVTAENAADIPHMVDTLAPYASQIDRWSLDQFIPANRGELNQNRYLIDDQAYLAVVEQVKASAVEKLDAVVIGGGLKKDKAGTVMMFGPQGIPYTTADNKVRYLDSSIRTQPLYKLVQTAEAEGLDLDTMNNARYANSYYETTKNSESSGDFLDDTELRLPGSQRDLWNRQHATRGESTVEYGESRFKPNEAAVILHENLSLPSRIIEVGAANGRDARYLAAKGHDVVALDFSSIALEQLRAIALEQGVSENILTQEWDVSDGTLPETGIQMNAFYARSALQVDDDTMMLLATNIDTILTPGGLIMIEGKGPSDIKIARSKMLGGNLASDPHENGHLRRIWTPEFTEQMCKQMGWDILDLSLTEQTWEGKIASFMRLMAKKK